MVGHEVNGTKLGLPPARHEYDRRLAVGVAHHGIVDRLRHRHEPAGEVGLIERVEVHLEGDRADLRGKVEQSLGRHAHPLADLTSVGQRGAEPDHPDQLVVALLLFLGADETHPGNDDFQRRSRVAAEEVEVVDDKKRYGLDALPLPPAAADGVPLLRGADYDLGLGEQLEVGSGLAAQLGHLSWPEDRSEATVPVGEGVGGRLLLRRDVYALPLGVVHEHPHDGKLGARGLARAGRRADQTVLVSLEEVMERLRLDRVELVEGVELRQGALGQDRDRQRLQVQELGRGVKLRGEYHLVEGYGQDGLGVKPAVRYHADEVRRRQRVHDADCEHDGVLILGAGALEQEHLVVQDVLPVDVLDDDVEQLDVPVDLDVVLEVGN
mmetsp:Transcript_12824/g.30297  ORF Transcript_12824/g.30297 Transcript_12824/m.30297 type:complete len:381 (-) Transcript_12824:3315-4457(-)